MNFRQVLTTGIVMAGISVAIGAFGAHALRSTLEANDRTETFELAVRYQFYHAFAIILCGVLMVHFSSRLLKTAAVCFAIGIVIFSGSLYALSLSGIRMLGAITPIGGLAFLTGWVFVLIGVNKKGLQ
jgi:uncharacterized membrane protein YgdD (TMEM256/DUF423 family)